jgi:hypothetical protein
MPRIGQLHIIARQQGCSPAPEAVSRQADAGGAAQSSAAISINNAPFLLPFTLNTLILNLAFPNSSCRD